MDEDIALNELIKRVNGVHPNFSYPDKLNLRWGLGLEKLDFGDGLGTMVVNILNGGGLVLVGIYGIHMCILHKAKYKYVEPNPSD